MGKEFLEVKNNNKIKLMISRKIIISAFSFIIILNSCQKQIPVELVDDTDDSNLINIQSLPTSMDSLYLVLDEDSIGNIGILNSKFFAKMVYQAIRIDKPIRIDSFIRADAIFLDKKNPIKLHNRIIAYPSFDAGILRFNNQIMNKLHRRINIPNRGDSLIGFRYELRNVFEYSILNRWSTNGNDSFPPFDFSINAPPQIRVKNLYPGTIVKTSEPLKVKWDCTNPEVNLFISAEKGLLQRQIIPVLQLKIKNVKNEVTIPVRILELLPVKRFTRYVFTFTSENKYTKEISGYPEKILIYSASVHSIMLNLHP